MMTINQRTTAIEALSNAESAPGGEFPRLLPGITLVLTTKGLVAFGGGQPQLFGGKSAHTVLPAVLKAMDGSRTTAEIAELLDLQAGTVDAVHALVRSRKLLCSGTGLGDHTERWLVRSAAVTAETRDPGSEPARGAQVNLMGDPALTGELSVLLAEDGVRGTVVDWAGQSVPPEGSDLVVVVLGGAEPAAELAAVDQALTAAGIPWLRVLVHAGGAEIGPRFAPRDELRYASWWPIAPQRAREDPAPEVRQAALGFAAVEIINLLIGAGRPQSAAAVVEFDAATGACRARPRAPRPSAGESACLAADYLARQSTPDAHLPQFLRAPEPDPAAIEPLTCPDLTRLLGTAFPDTVDPSLNFYVLMPSDPGRSGGTHLYRPVQAGLIDLAGVADEAAWMREYAVGAFAVVAVSVTVPHGSLGTTIREGLLHTGAAMQRLTAAAADLGFGVRDDVTGSLGELSDALGILAYAETLLEIVVLEQEPGDER